MPLFQNFCTTYTGNSAPFNQNLQISRNTGNKDIEILFSEIVEMRNRIIHGFRITSKQGEQILATKTRKKDGNIQFEITKEYLLDFIKKNEELSDMLYKYRGY